jgi:uncharacterized protein YidB (DUF937 family)
MGLLDQVISAAATSLGGGQQAGANPMVSAVLQLLNSPQVGGIEGLVKAFQSNGLGDVARSWVSTGQNMPASAEQVQSALGGGQIGQLASSLGISETQASSQLAQYLPQIIDQLTPNGTAPQGDLMSLGLEMLKGKLLG